MSRKCFVPVESWAYASPEIRLGGGFTDIGILAEAIVLFENIVLNIQTSKNLSDILQSFIVSFGNIDEFLGLVRDNIIKLHYYDFISAPVEKDGILHFLNIQDVKATESHTSSFQQKILYTDQINNVVTKGRHRKSLFKVISDNILIDSADNFSEAIKSATTSVKSVPDIESIIRLFVDSLPNEYKEIFPKEIIVSEPIFDKTKVTHTINIDFEKIKPKLPNINFTTHTIGSGLIHVHKNIYASKHHKLDLYLPSPIATMVMAKLDALTIDNKRFNKTVVELQSEAGFPDIRASFNEGRLGWNDILRLRENGERFRDWFSLEGGNPDVALGTYGEEFKASTGIKNYKQKSFNIASLVGTISCAAIDVGITGNYPLVGAIIGKGIGDMAPFVKELFFAVEEEGWEPRFFGNWAKKVIDSKE